MDPATIANFTAAITVNVTDNQNMQVFLPEFDRQRRGSI